MKTENFIKITFSDKKRISLEMGGMDDRGNIFSADDLSLLKNGERILPIMGEFHFSRYNPEEWEEELYKMKAGGIEVVSSYVFWIHHEEKPGEWNFSGCRDLRKFLKLCQKVGMGVWLRIGPWVHGECRNGGFPDWLANTDEYTPRTNDEGYLKVLKEYLDKLAEQTKGLLCKDGGPVFGIQLENEYGHCGVSPKEREEGLKHMHTLKKMAIDSGFDVPFYTATGWGSYIVDGETLPVSGAYVDAPWAENVDKSVPDCFTFSDDKHEDNIGSDWVKELRNSLTYDPMRYPYLTAELGGGMQATGHRRIYPWPADTEAMALCILGSGCNMPGYYMYHGGINPDGKYSTLQESRETGYNNDLPIKSYDFHACIRESGEINESYGRLKKLHLLIQDRAQELAGAEVFYADKQPTSASDSETLRVAARINPETGGGYLFINNHQRYVEMKSHENVAVNLIYDGDVLTIPDITVEKDECQILPFHIKLGRGFLVRTNASLLCCLGNRPYFYSNLENPVFQWEGDPEEVTILSVDQANKAFRLEDKLYIAENQDSCITEENGQKYLYTKNNCEHLTTYDSLGNAEEIILKTEAVNPKVNSVLLEENRNENGQLLFRDYEIDMDPGQHDSFHQMYLALDYLGDRAEVYMDDKLIDDWFTTGEQEWHVALKRFDYPERLTIRIYDSDNTLPNPYENKVFYDLPVGNGCIIRNVRLIPEYKIGF